jgi:predicted DNA-binding transcriptional regulator AlpA
MMDDLLTKNEVAAIVAAKLRMSERHVYDRYMALPFFPAPVLIESALGTRPIKRWRASAIQEFLHDKQMAA